MTLQGLRGPLVVPKTLVNSCLPYVTKAAVLSTSLKPRGTKSLQVDLFGLLHELGPVVVEAFEEALELAVLGDDLAGAPAVGVEL